MRLSKSVDQPGLGLNFGKRQFMPPLAARWQPPTTTMHGRATLTMSAVGRVLQTTPTSTK